MWRRVGMVVLLVMLAFGMQGVWGVYEKERGSRQLRIEAEAELKDLEMRETQLRTDISSLSTDRGVEEALRERYELGKEKEGVIVIVEPPAPPPPPPPSTFQRIRGWFEW